MDKSLELFKNSTNVAICIKGDANEDLMLSAIALTKYLQNEGKAVGVLVSSKPSQEINKLFKKYDVVYTRSAEPKRYVVSINYGDAGIEKVLHDVDEENNKVVFYIEPTTKDFSFDNVEYSEEGSNYDLTVTLGLKSYQEMGKIYSAAGYLFEDNSVVSITHRSDSLGEEVIKVNKGTTYA